MALMLCEKAVLAMAPLLHEKDALVLQRLWLLYPEARNTPSSIGYC